MDNLDKAELPKQIGINRRGFLKFIGGLGAGAALGFPKPNLPAVEATKEIQLVEPLVEKEWKIEEVLMDPTELLDNISEKIKKINPSDRNDIQNSFITMFSKDSTDVGFRENNRDVLIAAYQKYGEVILDLRNKISITKILPQSNVDLDVPFFSNMTRPFASMVDMANDKIPFNLNNDNMGDLEQLVGWFTSSLKGSYEEQKGEYIMLGKTEVDINLLKGTVTQEWGFVERAQIIEGENYGIDMNQKDEAEAEGLRTKFIDVVNRNLPLAWAKFKFDSLGSPFHRGYFEEIDSKTKGAFVGWFEFFQGMKSLSYQRKNGQIPPYNESAQDWFSGYSAATMHEVFHGLDPLFENLDDTFFLYHPEDYFNYLDEYLNVYIDLNEFLDNATPDELEGLLLDPLSLDASFGYVDQLITSDDFNNLQNEITDLFMVCQYFEKSSPENIPAQFMDRGKMLMNWEDCLSKFSDGSVGKDLFTKNINSFNEISTFSLLQFGKIAADLQNENPDKYGYDYYNIKKTIIQMKSSYILESFAALRNLVITGQLTSKDTEIYSIYQKFATYVYWPLAHTMTGPLGEYLKINTDIRINPDNQLDKIFKNADVDRVSSKFAKRYGSKIPGLLERFYRHISNTEGLKAKMLGFDQTNPNLDPKDACSKITSTFIENGIGIDLYYDSTN